MNFVWFSVQSHLILQRPIILVSTFVLFFYKGVAEIPEVVFVDSTNSPHLTNLGPETNDLNADVRAVLDSHAFVICVLRRCCVRIVLASLGDELKAVSTNVATGPYKRTS